MIDVAVLIMGAVQGSIFALLAMGFSLVYGVGGIMNLAHGAFYILSGYLMFWFLNDAGLHFYAAIFLGLLSIGLIAGLVYLALIKPFQDRGTVVMIITFAFAFFVEQFIKVYEVNSGRGIQDQKLPKLIEGDVIVFGLNIPNQLILALVGSAVIITLSMLFIKKTSLGKSIRAVSQEKEAAQLVGINVDKILMITLIFSAVLAGIASMLYSPEEFLRPDRGWGKLLTSFSIVILGGLGSLKGSVVGAFIIGFAKTIVNAIDITYSDLVPLIVIIVVLIVRPQGLFGQKEKLS